ncbi:integrase core domain-containing protein, partial [Pseudoroseicyclus aestuarii]|uniref:integrase core domain-containing protein n=1 Tax=Pseudoroseicyclus aestuarii TaxID=1795041 RepID=UPI001C6515B3
ADLGGELVRRLAHDGSILLKSWSLRQTRGGSCVHRHRFESIQHATRVIGDWISFYNHRRPHQALAMRTPAEAFTLAA